ncbi:MAG: OmpA family protein [Bacteroidetes bacterium]|nr:OmpA family protein [Bacteroidota bacterium]
MKKNLYILVLNSLIFIPALNYSQTKMGTATRFNTYFSKGEGPAYFTPTNEETETYTTSLLKTQKTLNSGTFFVAGTKEKDNLFKDLSVASINSDKSLSAIFFNFNDFDLKKNTATELDHIATALKDSPNVQLEISGHGDDVGSEKYNYKLAQKRIDAVLIYLKKVSAFDEKRIVVKNYGETMPLAGNETETGRALNRRVEISIKTNILVTTK